MKCAEVKEKLVDFLYDELSLEVRTSFVQHLEGCQACKAEVASFQKTLGSTRAALGGPLSQEPPMRAHLAVLEAAQAMKPSVATTAPSARTKRPADEDGFFTRILRSPWFLPAFGAASVATVVFLVRVLKNPEVLPGQQPHAIDESNVEAPRPALAPAPPVDRAFAAKKESPASGKGSVAALPPAENAAALGMLAGKDRGAIGTAKRKAHAEPGRATDEGLSGLRPSSPVQAQDDRFAQPPPSRPLPSAAPTEASAGASARPAAATVPARAARREASAVAEPHATQPQTKSARDLDDLVGEMAAPAVRKKDVDRLQGEGSAETKAFVANDKADREVGSDLDDSIRKADRLFASQDWNAAAVAYRDLLRSFPSYKDAPKWRERMNESLIAEARRQAKAKKATDSADALETTKRQ